MNKAFILFLACVIYFDCFSQDNKYGWILKKSEKGINVYSRKTANSAFKEVKSVVYIKTSLSSIVTLIYDWENYPNWVYKCGASVKLKIAKDTIVHYQTVIVPWPFENRDFISTTFFSQDKLTDIVTITSICSPKFIPEVKSHQRIKELKAEWTLVPLKEGNVQITYQLFVDPGGSIPAALVNFAAVTGPYETMVNFKEWVLKKKYQEARVEGIKESK